MGQLTRADEELFEFLLGTLMNGRHATDEHLTQVVTHPGSQMLNHGQDQRIPLRGDEILQISGV
jgi:hypothetical protein